MIGRTVIVAILALGALAVQAHAQPREVEVYYDRYGREVLVDIYTGETVDVIDRGERRRWREREYLFPRETRQDRYYLDDPEDVERLRRERRREQLGRSQLPSRGLPQYDDYRVLPDESVYGDDVYRDEYDYGRRDEPFRDDPYIDEGFAAPDWQNDPPRYEARPHVERAPLDEPDMAAVPQTDPGQEIINEDDIPPVTGLPDLTQPPQVTVRGASEDVAKIQILLDRHGLSPGVIDGRMGDNVNKAISAWREMTGEALRTYDKQLIDERLAQSGGDAFITYEITPADVAGPFVASVPADYGEKARMERLSYTSVAEMLAERFHMDEKYLRTLNPGISFDRPGTRITVVNVAEPKKGAVARIIADKSRKQVRAYDDAGRLVVAYPATIGSAATPSPTGTHTIERIALDPEYTYNPKINFQQGNNTKVLRIPPGPNGPVGTVWIALSKPTYGIHGTPEPSKIGKTESNGCIRLTNWDAQELAKLVKPGVSVEFVE